MVVVQAMAGAMAWHYRPFLCSLVQQQFGSRAGNGTLADIKDQWRAEGEILGEDFKVGWAADVCTGKGLMGFFSQQGFSPSLI